MCPLATCSSSNALHNRIYNVRFRRFVNGLKGVKGSCRFHRRLIPAGPLFHSYFFYFILVKSWHIKLK